MKNKVITFFLASSINDLEYDRMAIGDFVNQLNNIYEQQGVFIKLFKCESDMADHSIKIGGSQASLDDLIKGSDMCFVIFWHKVGDVTFHELQTALEAYKVKNKPKIVVYFKKMAEGENPSQEIMDVMHIIDNELLHYHREYSHIDSLKLGIITQLQVHGFVNAELTVKDNKIMYDDTKIMNVEGIPLFADNAEYIELLEEYTAAVEKCERLEREYSLHNGNYKIYRDLGKAAKERERLKSDLDELTENILNIGNSIASMTSNGKFISENIRKAIKCFDSGDYDGVLEALDPEDIEKNVAELDEIEHNITEERIAIIEEYRMRILALKAQAKWSEVYETYEKAVLLVENRPQMPKTVMYEYAQFLFQQTKFEKCMEVCNKVNDLVSDTGAGKRLKGQILNLCGLACYKTGRFSEANDRLSQAISIRRELCVDDKRLKNEYAETCVNLAKAYYYLNKYPEAESLYEEALEIYRREKSDDDAQIKTIYINMWLSDLYYQTNRHRWAEEMLVETLETCEKLADEYPFCAEYIADSAARLAHLNCAILNHRRIERHYVSSLKLRSRLMSGQRENFTVLLKSVCEILADCYEAHGYEKYAERLKKCNKTIAKEAFGSYEVPETDFQYYDKYVRVDMIEKWCMKTLEIRREMASRNPEAYEDDVVEAYKNLAELYLQTDELEKAEQNITSALELHRKLLSFNGKKEDSTLAAIYCYYADICTRKGEFENAEKMYNAAIDFYSRLGFENEYSRTNHYMGLMYSKFGKREDADYRYFVSVAGYIELFKKSPSAYIDRVINTLGNALIALEPEKEPRIMSELMNSF